MKKIFGLIREAWDDIDSVEDVFEFLFGVAIGIIIVILLSLLIVLFLAGIFKLLALVF